MTQTAPIRTRWLPLLAFPLLLSACVIEEVPPTVPAEDACGASALQGLVGQPRTVLATMRFGQTTRIIEPGMAVTMDYQAGRLNIWIAENGRIERVSCG
ncbi:I78 family peptidase inhibitor [Neotabrizicola sp. VNH66]|uniref:I78 family peptidase inhibitor n=1 Tax=Neotabrizicola sp. VNH66 TaxID=3400918 RepID=UPI003C0AB4C5